MASRKQRRRRQKERRHEYEFVYVDEEGHEVDSESVEPAAPSRNGSHNGKKSAQKPKSPQKQGGRAPRKVDPPSWGRVARRALIFAPLIFVAFSFLSRNQSLEARLLLTALYTAFFVPFMYLMDRTMYRSYLRRTGQAPPARTGRR